MPIVHPRIPKDILYTCMQTLKFHHGLYPSHASQDLNLPNKPMIPKKRQKTFMLNVSKTPAEIQSQNASL